jgi:hypothetical protein
MLSIPNQLEGAYVGQDVVLECHTEAYPASINYWTTERGDMIISGNFKLLHHHHHHHRKLTLFNARRSQIPRGRAINLRQSQQIAATASSWNSKYATLDQTILDFIAVSPKTH